MGSLPEGTLCFYCDETEAGYIPDGCAGAVCGPCLDLEFDKMVLKRKRRYLKSLAPVCKRDNNAIWARVLHETGPVIAEFLIRL